jgi:hypothetical protein
MGLDIQEVIEQAIDVTGGVRSNVEPYYLEKNQMYYFQNVDLDDLGARKKRDGCSSFGTAGSELGGLAPWVWKNQKRYVSGFWDNHCFITDGDYSWSQADSTGVSIITEHVLHGTFGRVFSTAASISAQTAQFVHSVYPSTSNPTLSALTIIPESGIGTVNASIHPRSVEWWQGRLWYGGLADANAYPDALYWSDILNGFDIDLSNNVRIDAEQGDEIVKILPVRSDKPRLYIFKQHSVHALDVVWTSGAQIPTTENTLDPTNSKVVPLTHDVGTVAPNSVVYASGAGDSDVFFLSRDGVRSLRRVEQDTAGGAGPPISEPIQDIIARINWDAAGLATSAIYDHKLFMAIPVDGAVFNNTTIVYDLEKRRWVGEYTLTPTDMITANFDDGEERLMGAWHFTTAETVGSATTATSGRHVFHMLDDSVSLDPSNTAVEYIEETKAYSFGHLGKKKRWNWAEFEFTPAETTITVGVYAKREDEDYKLINYLGIEPKLVYPILPAALPWDLSNTAKTIERISLMGLDVGRSLQIKLVTDSPGAFGTRTTRVSAWPLHEIWE